MTTNQLAHRAEQMEAARAEFWPVWEAEFARLVQEGLNRAQMVTAQTRLWRAFLREKNLAHGELN